MKVLVEKTDGSRLVGSSSPILNLKEKIANLSKLEIPVYIQGDAGTGKDLIAKIISSEQKLISIDSSNFESDWNLVIAKHSNKNTKNLHFRGENIDITSPLYIDKLEYLDIESQAILFRILDNQEFITKRKETIDISSRFIFSSSKDLPQLVKEGAFRRDLFQKINLLRINTPALSEIKSDIPALVNHFVMDFKMKYKKNILRLSDKLIHFILQYDWPGNTAQLKNLLEGMIILSNEKTLDMNLVPKDFLKVSAQTRDNSLNIIPGIPMLEYEKEIIQENLKSTSGNREKTAKILGISERTLYRKIKEFNLE